MNSEINGGRGTRLAIATAVAAAVAALAAGCGVVHVSFGGSHPASSAVARPATYRADLAYAQCMRANGVKNFPDPPPAGSLSISGQPAGHSSVARANEACKHLLATGSTGRGQAVVLLARPLRQPAVTR